LNVVGRVPWSRPPSFCGAGRDLYREYFGTCFWHFFQPTTQPTGSDVLYDLRGVWQSPRVLQAVVKPSHAALSRQRSVKTPPRADLLSASENPSFFANSLLICVRAGCRSRRQNRDFVLQLNPLCLCQRAQLRFPFKNQKRKSAGSMSASGERRNIYVS